MVRSIGDNLSISKVRQMIIHYNPKSGSVPIFEHVDCSKLPQNPDAADATDKSTSVAGGNLLAAMFGTADDEDDEVHDTR